MLNKVSKALHSSKSRYVKEWGNSIAVGFEILNSYLRRIAQRAIETQDAALLEDLANLIAKWAKEIEALAEMEIKLLLKEKQK